MTALDEAHAAMEAAPGEDAARLRFYERVADAELTVLLEREAEGDRMAPRVFEVEGAGYVLAFDLPERLTDFTGGISASATLSGRALAGLLAGEGLGLGLNLEVAPSSLLLPPEAVAWLAATLGEGPAEAEARIEEVRPPGALPAALLQGLDAKLRGAAGLARTAWLVTALYADGSRGSLLAFVEVVPGAEAALAGAVREALVFSGIEAGALDVAFFAASAPVAAALARHGLRIDLPAREEGLIPVVPGSDPDRPPRLR
jgi:hypothetical protein